MAGQGVTKLIVKTVEAGVLEALAELLYGIAVVCVVGFVMLVVTLWVWRRWQ